MLRLLEGVPGLGLLRLGNVVVGGRGRRLALKAGSVAPADSAND